MASDVRASAETPNESAGNEGTPERLDLDALFALREAGSEGPWEWYVITYHDGTTVYELVHRQQFAHPLNVIKVSRADWVPSPADAELIVAAVNNLVPLVERVRELEAKQVWSVQREFDLMRQRDEAMAELERLHSSTTAPKAARPPNEETNVIIDVATHPPALTKLLCLARGPGDRGACTRPEFHAGLHVAHVMTETHYLIATVWDDDRTTDEDPR